MIPRSESDDFIAAWRAVYERAFPKRRARAKWAVTSAAGPATRVRRRVAAHRDRGGRHETSGASCGGILLWTRVGS
jgi:hypothetical protein